MLFLDPIDLGKLEIRNVAFQTLAADPGTPALGQFYFNTGSAVPKFWNGSAWVSIIAGTGTVTSFSAGNLAPLFTTGVATASSTPALTFALSTQLANLVFAGPTTGGAAAPTFRALVVADIPTLTHTIISDFDTQVRTSRLDQLAAPTASVSMGSQLITNVANPVSATDGANKQYVDAAIQGVDFKPTAAAATTAALIFGPAVYANGAAGVGATLTAAAVGILVVDGYTPVLGDLILVKNEAAPANNGLYTLTTLGTAGVKYVLTRHVDMDTAGEFTGALIPVGSAGTTNANSLWLANPTGAVTVGTTAIPLTELNKAADLVAGTGITLSGNTVSINTAWTGQAAITTLGTITTGVWNGTAIALANLNLTGYTGGTAIVTLGTITAGTWTGTTIAVANGGTGATTAAAARTNLGAVGKYSATIGDGVSTAISITQATHGLASNGQLWAACYDATTGALVQPDITIANATGTVTFTFAVPPASNAYRVVLIG